jgi:hypothetical protein
LIAVGLGVRWYGDFRAQDIQHRDATTEIFEELRFMSTSANAQPAQSATDPLKSVATAMATAAEAMRDGAGDAVAKVRQVVPATTQAVSKVVYSGFYYTAYGIVFPTMFVTTFVPGMGPIAAGLEDGARAASDVLHEMKERRAAAKAAKEEGKTAPQA